MDPEETLERLVAAGVLVEVDGGESLTLGASFVEARTRRRREVGELDDPSLEEALASVVDGRVRLPETRGERVDMLSSYRALSDYVEHVADAERLQLLPVLERFSGPPVRDDGVPHSFTPVTGSQLKSLLRTSKRAVVYVWRDDCPPCEVTAEDLSALLPEQPDDLALLAVYGPDHRDVMDELGVVGAPTVLFVLDGAIDVRLQGPQYRDVIETEVETLRESG